jgi:putative transcriptional regulator
MTVVLSRAALNRQDEGVSGGGENIGAPLPGWVNPPPAPGYLLIAAPVLSDPSFVQSVLYLLEHDDAGTAAVILNRPTHTPIGQVLPDWHDAVSDPSVVFAGGPVQPDGALCLGRLTDTARARLSETSPAGPGARLPSLRPVVDEICTVDLDGDVPPIVASTIGLRIFAGHAGWAAGQLDDELAEGAWFVVPGRADDVFATAPEQLRRQVLRRQRHPLNLFATYPRDVALN